MSSDDQYFLDVLSSIPNDIRKYSMEVADSIDRRVDYVVTVLRDSWPSSAWLPKPNRPKPPPPRIQKPIPAVQRLWATASKWMRQHKYITAAIVVAFGAQGFYIYHRYRASKRRRRAHRAGNGARKEVVVIAGSPTEPILRSLSLDLERRGFIVYVVVHSFEEEQIVNNESRVDIRPLMLDITDPTSTQTAMESFHQYLRTPQLAFPGALPHHLKLIGFIVIPSSSYPSGPLETISPETWSDMLNAKVLGTATTTQAFLRTVSDSKARILFLTPNIIPSLSLPFHGIETSIAASLEAYAKTLQAELAPTGIFVSRFKLGALDCSGISGNGGGGGGGGARHQPSGSNAARADVLAWSSNARNVYGKTYLAQASTTRSWSGVGVGVGVGADQDGRVVRGSPLRELHHAVFDALTAARPPRVRHVGSGSLLYEFVGRWAPAGLVGHMLGTRRRVARDELLSETPEQGWVS